MAERLVINVAARSVLNLFLEADAWEAQGNLEEAAKVRRQAENARLALGVDDPYADAERVVPLTHAEEKQRAEIEAEDRRFVAAEAAAAAEKAELVAKLQSGTATPDEIQAALARLL